MSPSFPGLFMRGAIGEDIGVLVLEGKLAQVILDLEAAVEISS